MCEDIEQIVGRVESPSSVTSAIFKNVSIDMALMPIFVRFYD